MKFKERTSSIMNQQTTLKNKKVMLTNMLEHLLIILTLMQNIQFMKLKNMMVTTLLDGSLKLVVFMIKVQSLFIM